jgi:hypothetical protein
MKAKYTARMNFGKNKIIENSSDAIEPLVSWMSRQAEDNLDEITGEIIDNSTGKVLKKSRFAAPD